MIKCVTISRKIVYDWHQRGGLSLANLAGGGVEPPSLHYE